jgi:hypothetical protein
MDAQETNNGIMNRSITRVANAMLEVAAGILVACHPEWSARKRSNEEIRTLGQHFKGDVLNSSWKDSDKAGGLHRKYLACKMMTVEDL